MTLRKFLASLVAVALLSGLPGFVAAQTAGPDCESAAAAGQDDGCCSVAHNANCAFACSAAAAAVGQMNDRTVPLHECSPLGRSAASPESVSRPPDTAPPKPLS